MLESMQTDKSSSILPMQVLDVHEPPVSLALDRYLFREGPRDRDLAVVAVIDPEPDASYTISVVRPVGSTPSPFASKDLWSMIGVSAPATHGDMPMDVDINADVQCIFKKFKRSSLRWTA